MIDFSAWSHKRKHTNIFAILLVLGITGLVGWVVFLFTQKNLAQNMKDIHLDLICLAVFAVFTALALLVYFKTRFKIEAGYKKGEFVLEIHDPALPLPWIIRDPYTLSCEWVYQPVTARKRIKTLFLTVKNADGIPLVSFSASLGTIYDPPMNFEYKGEGAHQLVLAEKVYDLAKTQELAGVLTRHADKLKKEQQKV